LMTHYYYSKAGHLSYLQNFMSFKLEAKVKVNYLGPVSY